MAEQLEGLRDLNRALKRLDGKVASSISRSGIAAAGKKVQRATQVLVPKDTGNLAASIGVRTFKLGRTGYAAHVKPMRRRFSRQIEIAAGFSGKFTAEADGYYAHMVEFGTRPHLIPYKGQKLKRGPNRTKVARNQKLKIGGRWVTGPVQHPGTAPRPFMRPAWQATKGRLPDEMMRVMWRRIEREARKR